jgi:hypothetical protein
MSNPLADRITEHLGTVARMRSAASCEGPRRKEGGSTWEPEAWNELLLGGPLPQVHRF